MWLAERIETHCCHRLFSLLEIQTRETPQALFIIKGINSMCVFGSWAHFQTVVSWGGKRALRGRGSSSLLISLTQQPVSPFSHPTLSLCEKLTCTLWARRWFSFPPICRLYFHFAPFPIVHSSVVRPSVSSCYSESTFDKSVWMLGRSLWNHVYIIKMFYGK